MKAPFILQESERCEPGTKIIYTSFLEENVTTPKTFHLHECFIPLGSKEFLDKTVNEDIAFDHPVVWMDKKDDYFLFVTNDHQKQNSFYYDMNTQKLHKIKIKHVYRAFFNKKTNDEELDFMATLHSLTTSNDSFYVLSKSETSAPADKSTIFSIYDPELERPTKQYPIPAQTLAAYDKKIVFAVDQYLIIVDSSSNVDYSQIRDDPHYSIHAHYGKITDLAFSQNGDYLYSASFDGYVKKWDLCKDDITFDEYFVGDSPIVSVRPSTIDNNLFVATLTDGKVCIGNFKQKDPTIHTIWQNENEKNKDNLILSRGVWADFSPSDPSVFVASTINEMKVFDVDSRFF
ncbi:hypothetical protein TRFO_14671 [Tritrichomonas foetus]|uniref:Uncharacterized protein n=1 Tax=Tritrichomonas foetus TaxID=1144522 RepID=A0A1J4KUE0_9EUKA|nr:hypothetical protein TRFO_14671 [Tritrichomonas foetus]|eukprot:OHT14887.1 hypothetical protein TRFO_14671 [Tritrichomonas foetus]